MNKMYLPLPNGLVVSEEGDFKWYGIYNFYTNPEGLIVIVKVVLMTMAIMLVFLGILIPELEMLIMLALVGCIILYISVISYYILAVLQDGKSFYLYTMGELGIVGIPVKRTKDTLQAVGIATVIIGMLARNPQTSGSGAIALGSQNVYIDFSRVKKMTVKRSKNLICVKYKLKLQHIYVAPHQIDFVAGYISSHIKKQEVA